MKRFFSKFFSSCGRQEQSSDTINLYFLLSIFYGNLCPPDGGVVKHIQISSSLSWRGIFSPRGKSSDCFLLSNQCFFSFIALLLTVQNQLCCKRFHNKWSSQLFCKENLCFWGVKSFTPRQLFLRIKLKKVLSKTFQSAFDAAKTCWVTYKGRTKHLLILFWNKRRQTKRF